MSRERKMSFSAIYVTDKKTLKMKGVKDYHRVGCYFKKMMRVLEEIICM